MREVSAPVSIIIRVLKREQRERLGAEVAEDEDEVEVELEDDEKAVDDLLSNT